MLAEIYPGVRCPNRYPVIYALCWVFTLINGLVIIVMGQNNAKFTLVLLAMVTARLQVMT